MASDRDVVFHKMSMPFSVNMHCLDPCVNNKWIALPLSNNDIGIWNVLGSGPSKPYCHLSDHRSNILAMCFNKRNSDIFASSCRDQIIIWDLSNPTESCKGDIFFAKPGNVSKICFDNSCNKIAIASDNKIIIVSSHKTSHEGSLEGHHAPVNDIKFCPHYSSTLVSISDDRTFCVWDTREFSLVYRSSIITSSPLISIDMNYLCPHFIIGSADGIIKLFDLTDGNGFRQLFDLNLSLNMRKYLSKANNSNEKSVSEQYQIANDVESGNAVLSVEYIYLNQFNIIMNRELEMFKSGANDILLKRPPEICVASSNALLLINSRTFEVKAIIDLNQGINTFKFGSFGTVIGPITYASVGQISSSSSVVVCGTLFDNNIHVLEWLFNEHTNNDDFDNEERETYLSIVAENSLIPGSPLTSDMLLPSIQKSVSKGDIATGKKSIGSNMNQPLTFKSKINSSGYTAAPRKTMFKPDTSKKSSQAMKHSQTNKTSVKKMLNENYNTKVGPPCEICDSVDVEHQSVAILRLRFADDGSALACSLSNSSAMIMKSPFSKHKFTPLVGHNNTVNSTYFSTSSSLVITSSNDKTAHVWDRSGGDPIMYMTNERSSKKEQQIKGLSHIKPYSAGKRELTKSKEPNKVGDNPSFKKEIKQAQFYYIDKFILLQNGSKLLLYKYNVSREKDEIKSYQSLNRYKIVEEWKTSCSSFTDFTAVNSFFSHLVICATSGHSIEIYDLNRSVLCHTFQNVHNRPAYCLTINEGSCFATQPSNAHNVIASAARNDPVKIWDLRSKSSVHALQGHSNGAYDCQISFSPCGNYLASGSEDKTVYVYDLRMGTYCERLKGHTDVVTSVAFHPAHPLLATGAINSKLLFFNPRKNSAATQRQGGRKDPTKQRSADTHSVEDVDSSQRLLLS